MKKKTQCSTVCAIIGSSKFRISSGKDLLSNLKEHISFPTQKNKTPMKSSNEFLWTTCEKCVRCCVFQNKIKVR